MVPSTSFKEFLGKATEAYHLQLKESLEAEDARDYLRNNRRLSEANVQSFRLGYVADPLPGHELYSGKLAIPYLTRSGVVTMRFRAVPEWNPAYMAAIRDGSDLDAIPEYLPVDGPKYLSTPGDIPRPFNPSDLERREPFICIAEGEFDCMTAHQDGLPCVGIAGVNGWRPDFSRLFIGYKAVYILTDNDDKGQGGQFAAKLAATIGNSRVVMMPEGHDVNSWYANNGDGSIRATVEETS